MFGRVRTKVYRDHLLDKYPAEVFSKVRYGLNTQYPTEHSGMVRYDLDTCTRYFGNFGTPTKGTPGIGTPYRTHTIYISSKTAPMRRDKLLMYGLEIVVVVLVCSYPKNEVDDGIVDKMSRAHGLLWFDCWQNEGWGTHAHAKKQHHVHGEQPLRWVWEEHCCERVLGLRGRAGRS